MAPPDDLDGILDRIANGAETEGDHQLLRQLLREERSQSVVQLGKYTVNLGQGREIQVGDRLNSLTNAMQLCQLQHPYHWQCYRGYCLAHQKSSFTKGFMLIPY